MAMAAASVSSTFIWRRLHSLMGLWLILYLFEHFLVNSQAALWIGDDGSGFVQLVNSLESLPYLQVIETVFIGIPFLIHGAWGVKRALTSKRNSSSSNGSSPSLKYGRNKAFTWQRITSWILLVGVVAHVVQMRFLYYPMKAANGQYYVPVTFDEGLYGLGARLNVQIYSPEDLANLKEEIDGIPKRSLPVFSWVEGARSAQYSSEKGSELNEIRIVEEVRKSVEEIGRFTLQKDQVLIQASSPGKAMLLMVRDTFKSPLMMILYTIFVLAAAFHAFNGFWTSLITWGMILSYRSQKALIPLGLIGMGVLSFLGLAAIWGSYWINLRQ